jgi:enterochelin esterase family protein
MKFLCVFLVLLMINGLVTGQSFSEMLASLDSESVDQKKEALEAYVSNHPVPLIENKQEVIFIYRGEADTVAIAGDATHWVPSMLFSRISGTDYWYCTASYEADARLEYKIVVNGKDWILDPMNPQVVQGGMGPNSELLMPDYTPPMYTNERDVVPWGTYFDTVLQSKYLEEARRFRIYLPPKYETTDRLYPVGFFQDGFKFFEMTDARDIMDNMIYEKKISPFIAVFVEPVHRDDEYSGSLQSKYCHFIFDELMPFIDKNFRTIPEPGFRAQLGISNGGNIALWLVISRPDKNTMAAAFSSNVGPNLFRKGSTTECSNQKFYLDLGKYDIPFLVPKVQQIKALLERKGCSVNYHEYPEGHNWKFWQKHLPEALEYLFPY